MEMVKYNCLQCFDLERMIITDSLGVGESVFLKFNIYINHLGILLQYSFWICKFELEMWFCIFNKFQNDDEPGSLLEQQVPKDWNWEQFGESYTGQLRCSNLYNGYYTAAGQEQGNKAFWFGENKFKIAIKYMCWIGKWTI